jgi:hypothetical protein
MNAVYVKLHAMKTLFWPTYTYIEIWTAHYT